MKRFYTTLALAAASFAPIFAQKTVDLELTPLFPVNEANYPNLATNDTFYVICKLANLGTDAVVPGDTIIFHVEGIAYDNSNSYSLTQRYTNVSLAANAVDTIGLMFKQGESYGAGQDGNVTARFPNNSADTLYAYVNGVDANGDDFIDAGYDPTDEENPFGTSSNNLNAWIITFGSTGIKDVNFVKAPLNVFPNPANTQISFTNNFAATSTAVVRITDIAGRTVKTLNLGKQNAGSKTFNVDIAELNNGVYYIELVTDKVRSISKFTKN